MGGEIALGGRKWCFQQFLRDMAPLARSEGGTTRPNIDTDPLTRPERWRHLHASGDSQLTAGFTFTAKSVPFFSRTARPRRPLAAASAPPAVGHWTRVANAEALVCIGLCQHHSRVRDPVFVGWISWPLHHHHEGAPHCDAQHKWSATHRSLAVVGCGPPTPDHPLPPDGARRQASSGPRDHHHRLTSPTHPLQAQPYDP